MDASCVAPDRFATLAAREIAELPVWAGRTRARLGDFFSVEGERASRVRVRGDVARVRTDTTLLGARSPLPLVLAPTGFTRLVHHEGEWAAARAAEQTGIPYCVSTMSTVSIEDIRATAPRPGCGSTSTCGATAG